MIFSIFWRTVALNPGRTFGVDGVDIRPVISQDNVQHGLGLVRVRGHHAQEVLVQVLVTQVHTGGRVPDLGDIKDLQHVLNLDSVLAGAGTDQASDGFLLASRTATYHAVIP